MINYKALTDVEVAVLVFSLEREVDAVSEDSYKDDYTENLQKILVNAKKEYVGRKLHYTMYQN